jgi:hypothetical protein
MEQIASDGQRTFLLRVMAPDEDLGDPFDGELYPALVWDTRPASEAQKRRMARSLIASGCRYVVCGGVESEAWEHAADRAYTEQDLPEPVPDELFVMTTSHRGEEVDDVAFFFVHNTNFGDHDFTRYLMLLVGPVDGVKARLVEAVRAEVAESSLH